jgi:hypothetical protein
MHELLTIYLPILLTVLLAGGFALSTRDRLTAFWRGLIGCIVLLGSYHFIKALVNTANDPTASETDYVRAGFYGLLEGVCWGGLVGLAVGYAARIFTGQKRKH